MTKQDIADKLAAELEVPKTKAASAVEAVIDAIVATMKGGEKVNISGFGIFTAQDKEARTARNPRTGETIQVPAKKVAKFKPAKALKDALN